MSRKLPPKRVAVELPKGKCKTCRYSYDHYNVGKDGDFILGRCQFSANTKLLNHETCGNYKEKTAATVAATDKI